MKWFALALLGALALPTLTVKAQTIVPIGNIAKIDDKSPSFWGLGGEGIFTVKHSDEGFTPIMRTQVYDARIVEIFSRAQSPVLQSQDVHVMSSNGHDYILIRKFLLLEVKSQDAAAEGMSKNSLAAKWAASIGRMIPKVAPKPGKFGV